MSRYWSEVVRGLSPYVPGEQPKLTNLIKLNTNENPYGPSPRVIEAIKHASSDALRLYPDPSSDALRLAIAKHHDVAMEEVFVGNGSDEVLAHTFLALLRHDAPLLFPDVTYSFYPVYCGLYGIAYETVPLGDDFVLDVTAYDRPNGGIIFPNPNAPTGRYLGLEQVEALAAKHSDSVIVVDEAYVDFGGETAIPLTKRYENVLVVQTLSKSRSLAGLRVGFAVGHRTLIEALERVKNSFNSYPLDRLAIAGAVAAYEDDAYFQKTRAAVIASRARLVEGLASLGFDVVPSTANFVFARHPSRDAGELMQALRAKSIIVRHFRLPRIDAYLRITVGTDDECTALLEGLRTILA